MCETVPQASASNELGGVYPGKFQITSREAISKVIYVLIIPIESQDAEWEYLVEGVASRCQRSIKTFPLLPQQNGL